MVQPHDKNLTRATCVALTKALAIARQTPAAQDNNEPPEQLEIDHIRRRRILGRLLRYKYRAAA